MTIYAIGDIHGYADQMDRALNLIDRDGGRNARIVFMGDYTDRGPDSSGVLDRLVDGLDQGRNWVCIMGNHDRMFLKFLTEGRENDANIKSGLSWMNKRLGGPSTLSSYGLGGEGAAFLHHANGGAETLASYRINHDTLDRDELVMRAREAVPQAHQQFLAQRPLTHSEDGLLFVHAGIRPGIPLADQDEDDLLWIRDGWLDDPRDHGPLVVHGHTALDFPRHHGNRVNTDGGAGYGRNLVPVGLEDGAVFTLSDKGRAPLTPA